MNSATTNAGDRRTLLFAALPAGLLVLAFAARFVIEQQLPVPRCVLREFTGVPCPTCGGTRSLAALAELDIATALAMNPLVFLASGAVLLLAADQLIARSRNHSTILAKASAALPAAWLWATLAAVVVSNWVYLCLTLPR